MIDKLELQHLRTLDALYRFGNLSAAAEHLDVSQQAISLKLKKLRELLGDELFVRTGHGVVATPYAATIEPYIQKALIAVNDIPLSAPGAVHKTLVVSATDYTQQIIVAELMQTLRDEFPGVGLIVVNIESANLIRRMNQGEIDLVLTSYGYVPDGLITIPLFTEHYCCVTADPELAAKPVVSLSELVGHDFIVTSPGTGSLKGSADDWFQRQGYPRKVVVSVPTFFMAQTCLKKTRLVGLLPSQLCPVDGLYKINLETEPPGYEVVAAFHPRAKNDPLIMRVLTLLSERFACVKDD